MTTNEHWEHFPIEYVRDRGEWWEVRHDGCLCIGVDKAAVPVVRVGDTISLYGRGLGYRVLACVVGECVAWDHRQDERSA